MPAPAPEEIGTRFRVTFHTTRLIEAIQSSPHREMISDAGRRADLTDWLTHKVRPMFEQRILPISEDVMLKWRLMAEQGRKAGHTFSQPDPIIAATAAHHGLTVVTRDASDFGRASVPYLNPWEPAAPRG